MSSPADLLKAIRSGNLATVIKALEAGATAELNGADGSPGLPLAMACFMGHAEIVRELILRGGSVNFPDNAVETSPLSMAIRGKHKNIVRILIEHGAKVPEHVDTGLSHDELLLAQWKSRHFGLGGLDSDSEHSVIEEINVEGRYYGTDTNILDAEAKAAIKRLDKK